MLKLPAAEGSDGIIANHSSYDDAITKILKIRAMPDKANPFVLVIQNSLRYIRVLKECNLNDTDIERALGHPQR